MKNPAMLETRLNKITVRSGGVTAANKKEGVKRFNLVLVD